MAKMIIPTGVIGNVYGRLTIISQPFKKHRRDGKNETAVTVKCICGKTKDIAWSLLKTNKIKSCGSHRDEINKENQITHGQSNHLLYSVWSKIKGRCLNQDDKKYKNYGGRGIKICEEWQRDFSIFYRWSLENGYKKGLTIDRKNNNGNYEPSNCRWITQSRQTRNMRTTKLTESRVKHIRILYLGGQKTQKQIAGLYGVCEHRVSDIVRNKAWV